MSCPCRNARRGLADACVRWNSADEDNYTQPGIFWSKVLNDAERTRLVRNIAGHLINAQPFIQKRAVRPASTLIASAFTLSVNSSILLKLSATGIIIKSNFHIE